MNTEEELIAWIRRNAVIAELDSLDKCFRSRADGYNAQIAEAREKGLPFDCMLGVKSGIQDARIEVLNRLKRHREEGA